MSFIEFVNALRTYGVDVLLLALGVTFIVSLLKKTVLKNAPAVTLHLLPFAVGIAVYAIYRALATVSADPFTAELAQTVSSGFGCGCISSLYATFYEHFIKGRTVSPFYPLLEGVVPEERRQEAANALYKGCKELPEEERIPYLKENLKTYCDPPMSEEEVSELAGLLAEYLLTIQKK